MNNKVAMFLYDYTGIMAQPWLEAGYTCYIVDGQHEEGIKEEVTEHAGRLYKVGHMFSTNVNKEVDFLKSIVNKEVDFLNSICNDPVFVFGFPPCTDVAVSGAAHFKRKASINPRFQEDARDLALIVQEYGESVGATWAWENPVSVLSTLIGIPQFYFHPWEYGGYLPEDDVHPTYPEYIAPRDAYPKKTGIWMSRDFKIPPRKPVDCPEGYSTQHKKLGGKSLKTKNIRSATPRGFARAVFEANGGINNASK